MAPRNNVYEPVRVSLIWPAATAAVAAAAAAAALVVPLRYGGCACAYEFERKQCGVGVFWLVFYSGRYALIRTHTHPHRYRSSFRSCYKMKT